MSGQNLTASAVGFFFCPAARHIRRFSRITPGTPAPVPVAAQRFFPGSQSGKSQPAFSVLPARPTSEGAYFPLKGGLVLDIQQKSWAIRPAFSEHFGSQTGPNLPVLPGLTQQNLCYFVAFIGFKINHWLSSANERIRASPAHKILVLFRLASTVPPFPVRAKQSYTQPPGLSTANFYTLRRPAAARRRFCLLSSCLSASA